MYHFRPKKFPIRAGNKYVVLMNDVTAHTLDLQPSDRILLKNGKHEIIALLDISDNHDLKNNEAGLFEETWDKLQLKPGTKKIAASLADRPKSVLYIRKKLDGKELTNAEIDAIVKDIVADRLSDIEMTYFVSANFCRGMSDQETVSLTNAVVNNGGHLKFPKNKIVVDKHCIGGVPGNRSTMLAVPILVSMGLLMPKTSSRAITSPAGTADTMEVLANVTNTAAKLKKIAEKVGGFISWGGGVDIASADDKLIKIRNPMSLDPMGMLLASILAKKHAVGATHVLIDIPYGPDVKTQSAKQAEPLKKKFEKIGAMLGMKVKVVFTDGSQPIGNGVGPVLEAIDIMKVLKNDPTAPQDLVKKTLWMCGVMLEMVGKAKAGEGEKMALAAITSGKAYKKFQEIIDAQGRNKKPLTPGKITHDVKAQKSGKITYINNKLISRYARLAGAPVNPGAGMFVHKFIGDNVKKGDTLFTLYAESSMRMDNVLEELSVSDVYHIK